MLKLLFFALPVALASGLCAAESLRVMTFNIWVGGEAGKQPLAQTAKVIQAAKADLVGMQETHGERRGGVQTDNARKIAEMLGWHFFDQGQRTAIISRFPIITNTPSKWGAAVRLPSGKEAWLFNVHFAHAPYQPYQLLSIPYANAPFIKTTAEAVDEARKARGGQVERMLQELTPVLAKKSAVFVTGDFNEPSHQDWTERAAHAKLIPVAVPYPSTIAVTSTGLRDTYRAFHPDEVTHPGWTWTPITEPTDPKDKHDRIDFVFASPNVTINKSEILGEQTKFADIVVTPYPSDHRAVVTEVEIP